MSEKKYISLQTKVTKATADRMRACAEMAGLNSPYELLQVLVSMFLRVADAEHEPVAEEVEETEVSARWAEIFADWEEKTKRINTAKPLRESDDRLVTAIVVMRTFGTKVYKVRRIDFENDQPRYIDRNPDKTINALMRRIRPETARALLEIGRACGTKNLMGAVDALLEDTTIPRIKDDGQSVLPGFEAVEYGGGFVRHNNKRGENGSTI